MGSAIFVYGIIAGFYLGRLMDDRYDDYRIYWRMLAGIGWPVLWLCVFAVALYALLKEVRRGNFANSIRVLVFGKNVWSEHSTWTIREILDCPPDFKKNKVWGWLYRRAFARLVAMNKDRVEFCES